MPAMQVWMVWARMQFTVTALMKVDLPDAFEPVTMLFLSITTSFKTGSFSRGWYSPSR